MDKNLNRAYKNLKKVCKTYAKYHGIRFVPTATPPNGFETLKTFFIKQGFIPVYNGGDHGFLGQKGNLLFRAVHDYTHIVYNLGFDYEGETSLSLITQKEFGQVGESLGFSEEGVNSLKKLIHIEIKGQLDYYYENGSFVEDQKQFVIGNW
jgi:hypothetical protein